LSADNRCTWISAILRGDFVDDLLLEASLTSAPS
jgi:hypothetical protein